MSVLYFVGAAVCIAAVILFIICALNESKVTGLYKALGVYGRLRAYLFIDLLFCGIGMILMLPVSVISSGSFSIEMLFMLVGGIVCILIAIVLYRTALSRCPIQLRGSLLKNMLVSGMGISLKIAVFIFPVVWTLVTPQFREAVDSHGNRVLIDATGTVYTFTGGRVGQMVDDNLYVKY